MATCATIEPRVLPGPGRQTRSGANSRSATRTVALKSKGVEIDDVILDSLGHIIVSHHGQYEFGSPKLPATPEAFMVYYIDDLDAKINMVTKTIEEDMSDSDWTPWKKALETRLYRKRIE